ncbi:hypothetical protein BFZC1_14998 [Lysinibacillus fusiformis ZC1]|nr:hypothetical protein BFZC1_14998 [Lysinibacillus fusiformis ZC1]
MKIAKNRREGYNFYIAVAIRFLDKAKLVELRSYPDGTLNSVQDILTYNAKQLEIVK